MIDYEEYEKAIEKINITIDSVSNEMKTINIYADKEKNNICNDANKKRIAINKRLENSKLIYDEMILYLQKNEKITSGLSIPKKVRPKLNVTYNSMIAEKNFQNEIQKIKKNIDDIKLSNNENRINKNLAKEALNKRKNTLSNIDSDIKKDISNDDVIDEPINEVPHIRYICLIAAIILIFIIVIYLER